MGDPRSQSIRMTAARTWYTCLPGGYPAKAGRAPRRVRGTSSQAAKTVHFFLQKKKVLSRPFWECFWEMNANTPNNKFQQKNDNIGWYCEMQWWVLRYIGSHLRLQTLFNKWGQASSCDILWLWALVEKAPSYMCLFLILQKVKRRINPVEFETNGSHMRLITCLREFKDIMYWRVL